MKKFLSFALFDTGETILGALIYSTFFPLYITKFIDTKIYSISYAFAFLISFFFAVILGKFADSKGLRKQFFILFTILTTLSTFFLSFSYPFPFLSLIIFLLMAIFHQQAFVFYNSLLLNFESKGFVSGLGVSFGYIGSAIALIFLAKYLKLPDAYIFVAFIFLILSLPSFLFLKNPDFKEKINLKDIFKDKYFIFTIISILSLTEVANTLIAMMSIYLRKVYNFEDIFIYKVIGLSAIGGIIGGVFWGYITDRFSAKKVFPIGFILWSLFLVILPITPNYFVLMVGFLAGFSLAHLWSVSRIFILENFPPSQSSVRLSFLSLTERIASTTGLLTWSLFLFITNDNYKLSAFLMIIFPIIGFLFYIKGNKKY